MEYDAVAAGYDASRAHPRFRLYDDVTWHALSTVMPPAPARVLDAGAGTGLFALPLLQAGHEVTLLEPSAGMLETARKKIDDAGLSKSATFVQGGIERIDLPSASFDFVLCEGDPLSYCIGNVDAAAAELVRVLRPGGAFYVSVDNRWYAFLAFLATGQPPAALAAAREGISRDPYGNPVHAFDPGELEAVFARAGAVDVRATGKLVFAHLMSDAAIARTLEDPETRDRFVEAERALALDPRFAGLASHLHVVGRRPA